MKREKWEMNNKVLLSVQLMGNTSLLTTPSNVDSPDLE